MIPLLAHLDGALVPARLPVTIDRARRVRAIRTTVADGLVAGSCFEGFLDLVLDRYLGIIAFGLQRQGTPTRAQHRDLAIEIGGALDSIRNLAWRARDGDAKAFAELRRIRKKAPDRASLGLGGDDHAAYEVVERKLTSFFKANPAATVSEIAVEVDNLLTTHFRDLAMVRLLLDRPALAAQLQLVQSDGYRLPTRDDRLRLWATAVTNEIGRARRPYSDLEVPDWEEMGPKDRARDVLLKSLQYWGVKTPSDLRSRLARGEAPSRSRQPRRLRTS